MRTSEEPASVRCFWGVMGEESQRGQTEMAWTCTERGTGYTSGRLEPADRRPGGREKRRFILVVEEDLKLVAIGWIDRYSR